MKESERIRTDEPEQQARRTRAAESNTPTEADQSPVSSSGPQPLRPTAQLRTIARPQQPIPRPEQRPRFGRTMNVIKTVLPLVQRALPLLEGNVALAVANLLAPMPQGTRVDLGPMERALKVLDIELDELRGKSGEQSAELKRIGEQLEEVRDATDRQAARQQELADDLDRLRRRVTVVAVLGLILLAASLGVGVAVLLRTGGLAH
jgi:hypothetical protein